MIKKMKSLYKDTPVFDFVQSIRGRRQIRLWEKLGRPSKVPHRIKQLTIQHFARIFSPDIMIETGTFRGDMISACRNMFARIYSIELSEELYQQAKLRFTNFTNIELLQGDSATILPQLVAQINEPCLFWLDGHYSGGVTAKGSLDTPIRKELDCIFQHWISGSVILIDDAHEFCGSNDYPSIEELENIVIQTLPTLVLEVENNIIRIYDKKWQGTRNL